MASYRTIKIRPETYRELRVLAAEEGTTMLALLDRLISEARARRVTDRGTSGGAASEGGQTEQQNTAP